MVDRIIVDALDANGDPIVVTKGSAARFDTTLYKDGAVYVLTGKTVTATIRMESDPDTLEDATLEDISVTPGGGTVTAANGGAYFDLTAAMSAQLDGADGNNVNTTVNYLVEYSVTTDNYVITEVLRFKVRRRLT